MNFTSATPTGPSRRGASLQKVLPGSGFEPVPSRAAIQEEERQRLARDLHDCLGQQVTALRLSLEVLSAGASPESPCAARIAKTQQLAQELDRSIDILTRQLRPAALDHFGLPEALTRLVREWSERFGIPSECYVPSPVANQLDRDAASHVCRLTQEALHNVVKHARATRVSVSLVRHHGHYVLVVEDDGQGFNLSDVMTTSEASGGFGLTSMRERAELAGGELEIESSPGHGTTIVARIPVAASSGPAPTVGPTDLHAVVPVCSPPTLT